MVKKRAAKTVRGITKTMSQPMRDELLYELRYGTKVEVKRDSPPALSFKSIAKLVSRGIRLRWKNSNYSRNSTE